MATDLELLRRRARGIRAVRGVSRLWFASIATVMLASAAGNGTGPTGGQPTTRGESDSAWLRSRTAGSRWTTTSMRFSRPGGCPGTASPTRVR